MVKYEDFRCKNMVGVQISRESPAYIGRKNRYGRIANPVKVYIEGDMLLLASDGLDEIISTYAMEQLAPGQNLNGACPLAVSRIDTEKGIVGLKLCENQEAFREVKTKEKAILIDGRDIVL